MKVHLVSYATKNYVLSQKRLVSQFQKYYPDIQVHEWNDQRLKRTQFFRKNEHILCERRGAGYWLWKPYIIWQTLLAAADGDIVFYCDCDVILLNDPTPVINLAFTQDVVLFGLHGKTNSQWCKRDCFILMDCDTPKYHNADQVIASYQVYKSGEAAKIFVKSWLEYCSEKQMISDAPNVCGIPNLPDFIEHRHDQSILSLLALIKRIKIHTNPTARGMEYVRSISNPVYLPYSVIFDLESPLAVSFTSRLLDQIKGLVKRFFAWCLNDQHLSRKQ